MRYIFLVLLVSFLGIANSCTKDDSPPTPKLEITNPNVVLTNVDESAIVTITTNVENWTAVVASSGNGWCTATPKANNGYNQLLINTTKNTNMDVRETEITVNASGLKETVIVKQLGEAPAILVDKKAFNVSSNDTTILLSVVSNIEYEMTIADNWVEEIKTKLMQEKIIKLSVVKNDDKVKRNTEILFKQKGGDISEKVTIVQLGRDTVYKPSNPDGIKGDIKVQVTSGVASSYQPGEGIEKSFDNDMSTLYHSSWNNTQFPVTLEYRFTDADLIDYVVYHPRSDASNGLFKQVEVLVSTEAQPAFTKYGEYDFKGSNSPSKVDFAGGLIKPKAIQIVVKSGVGDNGTGFASCAEMEFYKKNVSNSIPKVFTNDLCTDLIPGITFEGVDTIRNDFYRNIALSMFRNEYPREFRIQNFKAFPNPSVKAEENKTSTYSLLDNPTGISVVANEELVVFVDDTKGENISLRVMDLKQGFGGSNYPLFKGVNKLKIKNKGLAYVMYHTDNASASPIKIHFASGTVNGYFDKTKHTKDDWNRLLREAKDEHFDVFGEYAHITYPVTSFKNYCNDGLRLIQVYDSIAWLEQDFLGLFKYNCANKNRMYFHVIYGEGYMYATSYRTAYHIGTLNELCNPNILRTSAIWGPAHEVGHVNQTRPGFKWVGMSEVSNNVYSLYVQSSFGNKTRIESEDLGEYKTRYDKAFTTIIAPKSIHGLDEDVFCKLIPFWQLQLYYANVKGNKDFYKDVHEQVRKRPNPTSNGTAQLEFVRICSDVAQEDLTEFFTAWGMLSPVDKVLEDYSTELLKCTQEQIDEVINYMKKYPKPALSFKYIYDGAVELFKGNKSIVTGTAIFSNNTFTFSGWENVVVYEVYDSSNNLTFISYQPSFKPVMPVVNPTVYAVAADGTKVKVQL